MIAEKWGITREEMEAFALESHERALRAQRRGPLRPRDRAARAASPPTRVRASTTLEKMAIAASRSSRAAGSPPRSRSQISDAAHRDARRLGARGEGARAERRGRASTTSRVRGADPIFMLTAPIPATAYALEKAGMSLDDIDLVEINEAFASVVLAWQKETGADLEQGQRQRRRDRARPPARRDRRPADDDAAARARAHRRPLRPPDDVRGRRPGQRDHHRAARTRTS